MTKDKKSNQTNQIKAEKPHNQPKVQSSAPSVRLLAKIEIKGKGMPHNLLVPATMAQTVNGFMKFMEEKFNKEYKFDQVLIDSHNGQYKVENQYTIGQCFKDFDKIIVKGIQTDAKQTPKVTEKVMEKVNEKAKAKVKETVKAVKQNTSNKTQKVDEKSTPKKVQNEVIVAETTAKSTLSKNQKKRLQKQKQKAEAKPETPKAKEAAPKATPKAAPKAASKSVPKETPKQAPKQVAKPTTPKVKSVSAPKETQKATPKPSTPKVKSVSPVKVMTPKKTSKSEEIIEDSKKLGKNAKRKLQRKDAEDLIKQKEAELKKLRQAIYEGINGYSQEEASKSYSESDCDSPAKASEVDEFLSKMQKVGKSAAKASTGNQSDSSSDFGSADKL